MVHTIERGWTDDGHTRRRRSGAAAAAEIRAVTVKTFAKGTVVIRSAAYVVASRVPRAAATRAEPCA